MTKGRAKKIVAAWAAYLDGDVAFGRALTPEWLSDMPEEIGEWGEVLCEFRDRSARPALEDLARDCGPGFGHLLDILREYARCQTSWEAACLDSEGPWFDEMPEEAMVIFERVQILRGEALATLEIPDE